MKLFLENNKQVSNKYALSIENKNDKYTPIDFTFFEEQPTRDELKKLIFDTFYDNLGMEKEEFEAEYKNTYFGALNKSEVGMEKGGSERINLITFVEGNETIKNLGFGDDKIIKLIKLGGAKGTTKH